jgi:hypothetical protein
LTRDCPAPAPGPPRHAYQPPACPGWETTARTGHAYQLFCVAHVPEAQGSLPWVEDYCTYAYQPRATVPYAPHSFLCRGTPGPRLHRGHHLTRGKSSRVRVPPLAPALLAPLRLHRLRLAAEPGSTFRGRAQATCPAATASGARGRRLHSLPFHRVWPCILQVEAGKKENAIVMARLRPRAAAGAEFCVGSWHGPVAFGAPAKIQMAVLVNVAAGTRTPDHTPDHARSLCPLLCH